MATVRAICRPYTVVSTICCRVSRQAPAGGGDIWEFSANCAFSRTSPPWSSRLHHSKTPTEMGSRLTARRIFAKASRWNSERSPYETLELDRDVNEEEIKAAYRRLAKHYHPDVYDGSGNLEEGETAEARFIKIQAAYELLMDKEQRVQYDNDHRVNPMKATKAWMEWLVKKKKAFDQRGDMAVSAWAEQQQREMNLRVRRLSRSKNDADEERRILAREKKASMELFSSTLKRHTLVLKKRDIMRRKSEADQSKAIEKLLASEGLELDSGKDDKA